jgi:ABC-type Fe3+-citrate transport system substrate-binding protein
MRANAKEPGHGSDPRMRKERQEAVEAKEQAKVDKEAAAKKEIEDAVQKERTISCRLQQKKRKREQDKKKLRKAKNNICVGFRWSRLMVVLNAHCGDSQ